MEVLITYPIKKPFKVVSMLLIAVLSDQVLQANPILLAIKKITHIIGVAL